MKLILSFLLNQANRYSNSKDYYLVKKKILERFGTFRQYHIQFIQGKECYSCNGTGRYYNPYYQDYEECWNCYKGWYKRPFWSYLKVYEFGKYRFHIPYKKVFKKPIILNPDEYITGYIEHNESKYGSISLKILYILFDLRPYIKRSIVSWWKHIKRNIKTKYVILKYKKINIRIDDNLPF